MTPGLSVLSILQWTSYSSTRGGYAVIGRVETKLAGNCLTCDPGANLCRVAVIYCLKRFSSRFRMATNFKFFSLHI